MVTRIYKKESGLRAIEGGNLNLIEPTRDYGAVAGEILEAVMTNLRNEISLYENFMKGLPEYTAYPGLTHWMVKYEQAKTALERLNDGKPALYLNYRLDP